MWYEENDQFIRAPTPQTYDDLIKNLENRDSVMFESVSLPKSSEKIVSIDEPTKLSQSTNKLLNSGISDLNSTYSSLLSSLNLNGSVSLKDLAATDPSLAEKVKLAEELVSLQKKVNDLEFVVKEKEVLLEEKDEIIRDLQQKIMINRQRPKTTHDGALMYKDKYLATKKELDTLMASLSSKGKVKRVSAREARVLDIKP